MSINISNLLSLQDLNDPVLQSFLKDDKTLKQTVLLLSEVKLPTEKMVGSLYALWQGLIWGTERVIQQRTLPQPI
jgi:hypothetical protein